MNILYTAVPVIALTLILVVLPALSRALSLRRRKQDLLDKLMTLPPAPAPEGPFGIVRPSEGEAIIRREVDLGEIPFEDVARIARAAGFRLEMPAPTIAALAITPPAAAPAPGASSRPAGGAMAEENRRPPTFSGPVLEEESLF